MNDGRRTMNDGDRATSGRTRRHPDDRARVPRVQATSLIVCLLAAVLVLAATPGTALAAVDIEDYRPGSGCPGDTVTLLGSDFDTLDRPNLRIRMTPGTADIPSAGFVSTFGEIQPGRILDVRIPDDIPPGTYRFVLNDGTGRYPGPQRFRVPHDCGGAGPGGNPELEILRIDIIGPVTDRGSGSCRLGEVCVLEMSVRNRGDTETEFRPAYENEGVVKSAGLIATSIPAGTTKSLEFLIDLTRDGLGAVRFEQVSETGRLTIPVFLAGADSSGSTRSERIYRDGNLDNHVETVSLDLGVSAGGTETYRPEKTGAEMVHKHHGPTGFACGGLFSVDRSGLGPPTIWREWDLPVGYKKSYTGPRKRCRRGGSATYVSLARFDTDDLRPPRRVEIESATLVFEADHPHRFSTSLNCSDAVESVALRHSDWPAGKREVNGHGVISSSGIVGARGNRVDITDWVEDWVSGERPNFGIAFFGTKLDDLSKGNDACVARIQEIELEVTYERR